ncbi:MAG TPA: hypothetical protein VFS76_04630 [Pyrinomonadaceae bacterium]|nr:hypothetical protein [Pyrinomonadaceae bacterium]
MKLSPEQLQSRLKMDYQVVMRMKTPLINVTAYRNADDLEKRQNPIMSEDQGHLATHYIADYRIKTLAGPDDFMEKTSVSFDLLANGNYPFSWPGCFVISSRLPWTPHFRQNTPICIDHDMWKDSRGKMLFGELVVHVAKLLNFDEIPRSENYGGYTPAAAAYWRTKLKKQPITPNLPYPPLPPLVDELTLFSASRGPSSDMFSPKSQSIGGMFQPKQSNTQSDGGGFDQSMFKAK